METEHYRSVTERRRRIVLPPGVDPRTVEREELIQLLYEQLGSREEANHLADLLRIPVEGGATTEESRSAEGWGIRTNAIDASDGLPKGIVRMSINKAEQLRITPGMKVDVTHEGTTQKMRLWASANIAGDVIELSAEDAADMGIGNGSSVRIGTSPGESAIDEKLREIAISRGLSLRQAGSSSRTDARPAFRQEERKTLIEEPAYKVEDGLGFFKSLRRKKS